MRTPVEYAVAAAEAGHLDLTGRTQIGIRPEHVVLTAGTGVPVTIRRVEDVGRHRLVRAEAMGQPVNVVVPEGMPLEASLMHVSFAPQKINVYADDWRVAPQGASLGRAA